MLAVGRGPFEESDTIMAPSLSRWSDLTAALPFGQARLSRFRREPARVPPFGPSSASLLFGQAVARARP